MDLNRLLPLAALALATCTTEPSGAPRTAALSTPTVADDARRGALLERMAHTAIALDAEAGGAAAGLRLAFGDDGGTIALRGAQASLHVRAVGRAGFARTLDDGARAVARDGAVHVARGGVDEWWRLAAPGAEIGATIAARPEGSGPVELDVAVDGFEARGETDAPGAAAGTASGVVLVGPERTTLEVGELYVLDARGRVLPASMQGDGPTLRIAFDDRDAAYPVTVDPLVWTQDVRLRPVETAMAMTVVLGHTFYGVPGADSLWSGVPFQPASEGGSGSEFGASVDSAATSSTAGLVLVGAPGDDGDGVDAGAAYVFTVDASGALTASTRLTGPAPAGARMGTSVALAWSAPSFYALVGAPAQATSAGAGAGMVYVFRQVSGTWSLTTTIIAADGAPGDGFGSAVAGTSDIWALAGAPGRDVGTAIDAGALYPIFYRVSGATGPRVDDFAPAGSSDHFGASLAMASTGTSTVGIVGAPGASPGGLAAAGAAYGLRRNADNTFSITGAFDGVAAGDHFGAAVAVASSAGPTYAVGAPDADTAAGVDTGTLTNLACGGSPCTRTVATVTNALPGDHLGSGVSVAGGATAPGRLAYWPAGTTASTRNAIGFLPSHSALTADGQRAFLDDGEATESFVFTGGAPSLEAIIPSRTYVGLLAVSGDGSLTLRPDDNVLSLSLDSQLIIDARTGSTWSEQTRLNPPDGLPAGDQFGGGVVISGDGSRIAVSGLSSAGSRGTYVFVRVAGGWTLEQEFHVSEPLAINQDGSRMVLYNFSSYLVEVRSGSTWTLEQTLPGTTSNYFGVAISAAGDRISLAPGGGSSTSQPVYVYARSGSTWTRETSLTATGTAPTDQFGYSAALSADGATLVVGAPARAPGGAVIVYSRAGTTWTQSTVLTVSDAAPADGLGTRVSISADGTRVLADMTRGAQLFVLRATTGSACAAGSDCVSGFCADGVCCTTACAGGTADCQACSVAAGAPSDGTCAPLARGTTCRAATGVCDVAETCDGATATCPPDGHASDGTPCPDGRTCNGAETCHAGACTAGAPVTCVATMACTTAMCVEPTGCVSMPDPACVDAGVDVVAVDAGADVASLDVVATDGSDVVAIDAASDVDVVEPSPDASDAGDADVADATADASDADAHADASVDDTLVADAGGPSDTGLPDASASDATSDTVRADDAGVDVATVTDAAGSDAARSDAAQPAGDGGTSMTRGGCGCRTNGAVPVSRGAWGSAALLGLAVARRRSARRRRG